MDLPAALRPEDGEPNEKTTGAPPVVWLDEIDSTNREAFRRAATGERGPLWIVATRQLHGRGRNGRHWHSEPGNLYASLLFEPGCPAGSLHHLSLLAGVAVIDTLKALAPAVPARLKWPNDVLVSGAKLCGILPEALTHGSDKSLSVLGIGINLAATPTDLDRAVISLADLGCRVEPARALDVLAACLETRLGQWRQGDGFLSIRAAWLERAGPPGEPMTIDRGDGPIPGRFAGLDADGALLLEDGGRTIRYTWGDVALPLHGGEAPAGSAPFE